MTRYIAKFGFWDPGGRVFCDAKGVSLERGALGCEQLLYDLAVNIGKSEVASLVAIGKAFVVKSQAMQ
jgi:hypothetical protein